MWTVSTKCYTYMENKDKQTKTDFVFSTNMYRRLWRERDRQHCLDRHELGNRQTDIQHTQWGEWDYSSDYRALSSTHGLNPQTQSNHLGAPNSGKDQRTQRPYLGPSHLWGKDFFMRTQIKQKDAHTTLFKSNSHRKLARLQYVRVLGEQEINCAPPQQCPLHRGRLTSHMHRVELRSSSKSS